ncbi:hypothetical protein FRC14_004448 [Serendipita sp. 396]|nr:hypothetical protein FRC14_004448 [Serendipita sp. 396]KAG8782101.1 hypothetical protein FRC15_007513 [Serendipita sp. 397]KAG8866668.1 hypothetical protein FRC20_007856 [Serendipita sp. 405]
MWVPEGWAQDSYVKINNLLLSKTELPALSREGWLLWPHSSRGSQPGVLSQTIENKGKLTDIKLAFEDSPPLFSPSHVTPTPALNHSNNQHSTPLSGHDISRISHVDNHESHGLAIDEREGPASTTEQVEFLFPDKETEELFSNYDFGLVPIEEIEEFYGLRRSSVDSSRIDALDVTSVAESVPTTAPSTPTSRSELLNGNLPEEGNDDGASDGGSEHAPPSEGAPNAAEDTESSPIFADTTEYTSADVSIPVAQASSKRKRILLMCKQEDGSEPSLPRGADGYAIPLAIYTRLNDRRPIKTEALDRIIAPTRDTSLKNFVHGTITCRLRRKIVEGKWSLRESKPCGVKLDSWDSYRRHILRSHLDLPRGKKLSEMLKRRIQEVANMTDSSVATEDILTPESPATLLGVKRPREDGSDVESDTESDEDYSPKARATQKKRRVSRKQGKEL